MNVHDIKARTDLSRAKLSDKTDPPRKAAPTVFGTLHCVILQMTGNHPFEDESRSIKVGVVVPKDDYPSDPAPDPDTGIVPSAFKFAVKPGGKVRLFEVFCEPDMRAKHYAQWLWSGNFDADAPVFFKAMRVLKLYSVSGYLFCEYSNRIKYTRLLGGFVPSDCYINQVT